ncbi:MAG: cysteine rich repeat-containing protein [Pseudomonadota bacterium]
MPSCFQKIYVLLMLALLFSASSYAEQAGKPLAEKLPENIIITSSVQGCDEDVKQHCDGLGDDADKVFMCLAAYEEHLSTECKQGILEAALSIKMGAAALDYSISACEADADKHCLDVQPGEGRMVSCIKANESTVSKECITALKETGLWELGK